MHCGIPTLTTDSNMPNAANYQGISHCLENGHPDYYVIYHLCDSS